jgi:hypothetical protein
MALQLVKNSTTDEYSFGGANDDPVSLSVNLDDTGGTEDSSTVTAQIRATTYLYTGIAMSIQSEESGIDYKLSLNNTNFFDSLTSGSGGDAAGEIADIDATSGAQTKTVYIKSVVNNNGTVTAGNKTGAKVRLTGTENQ